MHFPGSSRSSAAGKSDASVSNRESEPGNSDLSVRKTELVMIFRVLGTMEEDQSYGFESRKEKWQWGVSRFDFLITRTFPSFRKGW